MAKLPILLRKRCERFSALDLGVVHPRFNGEEFDSGNRYLECQFKDLARVCLLTTQTGRSSQCRSEVFRIRS